MQQPISKVSLSVRELVEFILASGSIDNRGGSGIIEYLGAFHQQDYYYPAWV